VLAESAECLKDVVDDDGGHTDGACDEGCGGALAGGGLGEGVAVGVLALEREEQRSRRGLAGVEHGGLGDLGRGVEDIREAAADGAGDHGQGHGLQRGSPAAQVVVGDATGRGGTPRAGHVLVVRCGAWREAARRRTVQGRADTDVFRPSPPVGTWRRRWECSGR
jgi:hypothetical protein